MDRICTLDAFLKIICDRHTLVEDAVNESSVSERINQNKYVKEYMELFLRQIEKSENTHKQLNQLADYLKQNAKYIYSYKQRKDLEIGMKKERATLNFFYRGIGKQSHKNVPGIYRKSERHEEYYYFNEINVRCPEVFRSFDNLEKLTYMQHYGCPTRLLDITSNPLVALFFACCGSQEDDGIVVIFAIPEKDILYPGSDRVQMLSKLAEFKKNEQEELRLLSYRYLLDDKFLKGKNGHYKNTMVERFYHEIKRNNGAFERDIKPFDILKPQFVQPNKDNPRILKQDGAFIISGLNENEDECEMKIEKSIVRRIIIPSECKTRLFEELEYVGINQATLFPEVEKVADYLRKR